MKLETENKMGQIDISDERVNNAIALYQKYGAPLGIRHTATVIYPGGSYINDQITFVNKQDETLSVMTNLAVIAPGVTLNLLSQDGFIVPPLQGVDTAAVYPGVNDFNITSKPTTTPTPVATNFIGPEMIPGSGRHYAIASPLDHFGNGGIMYQGGKYYTKVIVAGPFGNMIEWDEITVVGPPLGQ